MSKKQETVKSATKEIVQDVKNLDLKPQEIHYKFLNNQMKDKYGRSYNLGLNKSELKYRFTKKNYMFSDIQYEYQYIAELTIPKNAQTNEFVDCTEYEQVYVNSIKHVSEESVKDVVVSLYQKALEQDADLLFQLIYQPREICLKSVQKDGRTLRFVNHQTEELCMEAVKQNGLALCFVCPKFRKEEIEKEAVKQNSLASILKYEDDYNHDVRYIIKQS